MVISDAQAIVDIISNCNPEFIKSIAMQSTFDDMLQKIIHNAVFIVASIDDIPVGYIAFYANDSINKTAYVSLLAVNPDYHNQGIGHTLMQECEKVALNNGMCQIKLTVRKLNENAIRFYQKHDFTYLRDLDEIRIYMIKSLGER